MTISVIIGSTRQGRFSEKPAQWILEQLHKREGIEGRLLDLRDFPMPFFDQSYRQLCRGGRLTNTKWVKKWTAQSRPRMDLYLLHRNTTTALPRC